LQHVAARRGEYPGSFNVFPVMTSHLTGEDIARLRSGRLSPDDVLAMTSHLEQCAKCREAARGDAASEFLGALAGADVDDDHPDPETRLFPYVDGTLPRPLREEVDAHLAVCELCREDVVELRATRVQRRGASRSWIAVAAAIAVVAMLVAVMWWQARPSDVPVRAPQVRISPPVAPMPAPWRTLLQSAVTTGRIEPPAELKALRAQREGTRGGRPKRSTLRAPVSVIVESVRPRFTWAPEEGTRFRISLFEGDQLVLQSPFTVDDEWECDRDLTRGSVYSWQVEIVDKDRRTVMPEPGAGDALFRVLDESAAQEIAAARQRYPDDHLLAGVLLAHYGVRDGAEEELERAADNPSQAAAAKLLIDDVRGWVD
jgi:anti-sigma factor RsiW